jgi:hypothetical protein
LNPALNIRKHSIGNSVLGQRDPIPWSVSRVHEFFPAWGGIPQEGGGAGVGRKRFDAALPHTLDSMNTRGIH